MPPTLTRGARHVLLGAVSLAGTVVLAAAREVRDGISAASWASAYVALFWLAVTLGVGPVRVLRGLPSPVSTHLRRDLGIWAAVMGVAHATVGLFVHLRGRPWLYFVDEQMHVRTNLFGVANHTGLVAALLLLALGMLSNDLSLRSLGSKRWKSWQRGSYVAAALAGLHGFLYQAVEKRGPPLVVVVAVTLAAVLSLQLAGVRARRRARAG